jgi:hypothetical protein
MKNTLMNLSSNLNCYFSVNEIAIINLTIFINLETLPSIK